MTGGVDIDYRLKQFISVDDLKVRMIQSIRDKQTEKPSGWPVLTLSSHQLFGGTSSNIHKLCDMTEFIILALDIMDDLQDQDNDSKVWMTWNPSAAMNVMLALLMSAFEGIEAYEGCGNVRIGDLSRFIIRAVNGQHMDTEQLIQTEADYVESVVQKSGSLIRLAMYVGYAAAGMNHIETRIKMDELADCIGMMAQLENDLQDVLRYDIKNDLLGKKKTLPILYLLEHSEQDCPILKQYYDGLCSREQFLQSKIECMRYIEGSGCIEYTKVIQALYFQKADEILDQIDVESSLKRSFKETVYADFGLEVTS